MSQGGKYYKKRKQNYNRPHYSKAFSIRRNYTYKQEYTMKIISNYEEKSKEIKPIESKIKNKFDNKENTNSNSNTNTTSSIFNLSLDIVDNAYFIPKKYKPIFSTKQTDCSPLSTAKSNNYFRYFEDYSPYKTINSAHASSTPTCDERYSNCSYIASDHLRKMSTRSTSGSFHQIGQFTTDDNLCHSNDQSGMILLKEDDDQILNFAPLKQKDSTSGLNSHHIIEQTSITNVLFNRYNLCNIQLNQENTDVLSVNVKITTKEIYVFKLKRFDDLFKTVKLFCEINKIEERFIKPLIIKSLETLNQIYQVINYPVESEDKLYLNLIRSKSFNA